jgi:hypothetical protein
LAVESLREGLDALEAGRSVSTSAGSSLRGFYQPLKMEPAIRIERTPCGLRISASPTSDNLTPQETTNQDAPDMGPDGADLSCPGSSVVASPELEADEKPL